MARDGAMCGEACDGACVRCMARDGALCGAWRVTARCVVHGA
jgi:hypothetical protein